MDNYGELAENVADQYNGKCTKCPLLDLSGKQNNVGQ
jgi:hypothetical protein